MSNRRWATSLTAGRPLPTIRPRVVRRLAAILLCLAALLTGTGLLAHLHDLAHDLARAVDPHDHPLPSDTDCPTHAALHAPGLPTAIPPVAVRLAPVAPAPAIAGTAYTDTSPRLRPASRAPPVLAA